MTRTLLTASAFGALYVVASGLSRMLSVEPTHFATFWIASGIYLGVLLRVPARRWPALLAAGWIARAGFEIVWVDRPFWIAAAFATANSLEALTGAALCRRYCRDREPADGPPDLARLPVLLRFVFIVAVTATAAGATVGAAAVVAAYPGEFRPAWAAWFTADLIGVLLVSPLLLISGATWTALRAEMTPPRRVEAGAALAAVVGVGWYLYWQASGTSDLTYLLLPIAVWIALRFRMPGIAVGMFVLSVIAVLGVTRGHGSGDDVHSAIVLVTRLQVFLTVVGVCLFGLAAAVTQARETSDRLDALNQSLASEVDRQTAASTTAVTRLRLALEGAEMGTWQWTVGTADVVLDRRQRAILGVPESGPLRSEIIFARMHPDDLARIRAQVQTWSSHGGMWEYEHRVLDPSGEVRWVAGRAALVQGRDGQKIATGVTFDITRQRAAADEQRRAADALRESDERFRQIADHLDAGLWMFDAALGRVRYASSGFQRVWNVGAQQLLGDGSYWLTLVHPDDRGRLREAFLAFVQDRAEYHTDYRLCLANGETRWVEERAFVVTRDDAGAIRMVAGLSIDVTLQREADRQKDEFLAMLAHELRNPLAPIRAAAHVLGRPDLEADIRTHASAVVERQVSHVVRLVDDLVDVSRLSRGLLVLQRSRVDLAAIVRETVADYAAVLAAAQLQLDAILPSEPVWVDGDPTRMAQVLGNLLHNARKFTPEGGVVGVALSPSGADSADSAVLTVWDSGRGIGADLLPRVFEAFSQGSQSLDRGHGGLGLGLSLVRGLIELHGGTVSARSDGAGRGATFVVRLPLAAPPRHTDAERPALSRAAEGLRVLIVEDNVDAADMLRAVLEIGGHHVAVAHTGLDAVGLVETFAPDLVLCDIGLPGALSGLDVARQVRARGWSTLTLVAVTGYAGEAHVREAEAAGFDRHLTKPVGPEDLEAVLRSVRVEQRQMY